MSFYVRVIIIVMIVNINIFCVDWKKEGNSDFIVCYLLNFFKKMVVKIKNILWYRFVFC